MSRGGADIVSPSSGVLVASEPGEAVTYGLNNAQGRGLTFVEPGTQVYEGMIVGQHPAHAGHRHQRLQGKEEDQHPLLDLGYRHQADAADHHEPGAGHRLHQQGRAGRGHARKASACARRSSRRPCACAELPPNAAAWKTRRSNPPARHAFLPPQSLSFPLS